MFIIQLRNLIVQLLLFTIIGINSVLLGRVFFERAYLTRGRFIPHLMILMVVLTVFWYKDDEIHFPYIAGAIMLIITSLLFKGKASYKLWVYIMMIDIVYTCNLLGCVIIQDMFHIEEIQRYEGWLAAWSVSTVLVVLLIKILHNMAFYNKTKYQGYSLKRNVSLGGIGIIYFGIMVSLEYTLRAGGSIVAQSVFPLLAVYIVAIGGFWCLLMSHHSIKMTYEEEENKLQRRFFKKHLKIYTQVNKLGRAQEDFKQEATQSMSDLLKHVNKEKLEDLQPLIQKIETRRETCKPYIVTGNTMLDMLMNEKYDRACKRHIDMKVNISLPEKVGMGNVDLCMLLSNTLDYALDQCEHVKEEREKSISIEGVWYKGYLMFKLYYTTPEEEISKGAHSSDRLIRHAIAQDPYGLGTVVKHIRKHEGELSLQECGWGEKKLTFSLNVAYSKVLATV